PRLPRDAETICLKCLEKEPARRYATAQALADDLKRFTAGEPIAARAVGPAGRLARGCRRRPVTAGLLAALVLTAATGLRAVLWQWRQAQRERDEARVQRDRAADNLRLARQAVDRFLTGVSENRLLHEPAMEGLRKELLQSAVGFYEQLSLQEGG